MQVGSKAVVRWAIPLSPSLLSTFPLVAPPSLLSPPLDLSSFPIPSLLSSPSITLSSFSSLSLVLPQPPSHRAHIPSLHLPPTHPPPFVALPLSGLGAERQPGVRPVCGHRKHPGSCSASWSTDNGEPAVGITRMSHCLPSPCSACCRPFSVGCMAFTTC